MFLRAFKAAAVRLQAQTREGVPRERRGRDYLRELLHRWGSSAILVLEAPPPCSPHQGRWKGTGMHCAERPRDEGSPGSLHFCDLNDPPALGPPGISSLSIVDRRHPPVCDDVRLGLSVPEWFEMNGHVCPSLARRWEEGRARGGRVSSPRPRLAAGR